MGSKLFHASQIIFLRNRFEWIMRMTQKRRKKRVSLCSASHEIFEALANLDSARIWRNRDENIVIKRNEQVLLQQRLNTKYSLFPLLLFFFRLFELMTNTNMVCSVSTNSRWLISFQQLERSPSSTMKVPSKSKSHKKTRCTLAAVAERASTSVADS